MPRLTRKIRIRACMVESDPKRNELDASVHYVESYSKKHVHTS